MEFCLGGFVEEDVVWEGRREFCVGGGQELVY